MKNRQEMLALVDRLRGLEQRAADKSSSRADRFSARGQLLPRERLIRLLDMGAPFLEIGNLVGYMDDSDESSSVPGAALIVGIGFVAGVRCLIVVNDSGIDAGAMTVIAGKKFLRAQRIALENRLPTIMLVESAGGNLLEYQVDSFLAGGAFFANMARLSASGLPVITVLHGSSTAGGAYMPGMSDVVIGVRARGKAFLAGPPLLKAATGEVANDEELGGVDMHSTVSGLVDHVAEDDSDAIRLAREVVERMHWNQGRLPAPRSGFEDPIYDPDEIAGVVPLDFRNPYDVREVVARIVDSSEFLEFKPLYGPSTVCIEADIHSFPIGIVGNNGPIDNHGATKASHFIQRCSQLGTPLLFLQNTTGFMVGTGSERAGMIKHGSKMIAAVANTAVPRITFMIGASFGAGNYAMSGRGYEPRFLFTWPNARTGVMGAQQAATTMRIVAEERALRRQEEFDESAATEMERTIVDRYQKQESAFVTSARVLDDGMIDPRNTRQVLGFLLATVDEAHHLGGNPMSFAVGRT